MKRLNKHLKLHRKLFYEPFLHSKVQKLSAALDSQCHISQGFGLNTGHDFAQTIETNSVATVEVGKDQEVLVTLSAEF